MEGIVQVSTWDGETLIFGIKYEVIKVINKGGRREEQGPLWEYVQAMILGKCAARMHALLSATHR
jgi:hypothetical protein